MAPARFSEAFALKNDPWSQTEHPHEIIGLQLVEPRVERFAENELSLRMEPRDFPQADDGYAGRASVALKRIQKRLVSFGKVPGAEVPPEQNVRVENVFHGLSPIPNPSRNRHGRGRFSPRQGRQATPPACPRAFDKPSFSISPSIKSSASLMWRAGAAATWWSPSSVRCLRRSYKRPRRSSVGSESCARHCGRSCDEIVAR